MDTPNSNRAVREGRALDESSRAQMESLAGHDLKDVRVHDSRQAGELAGRLGAEAFTVGADIYGPPGRLTTSMSEGAGLLAHETAHVVQQSGPRGLAVDAIRRPLLGAMTGMSAGRRRSGPDGGGGGQAAQSGLVGKGMQRAEEVQAQAFEHVARESVQRAEGPDEPVAGEPDVDMEAVAGRVYRMMRRELKLERERR